MSTGILLIMEGVFLRERGSDRMYTHLYTSKQARSCLYASTQLNPHYFDQNKKKLFKKMWFEIFMLK